MQFHAKYPLFDSQSDREFTFSYAILQNIYAPNNDDRDFLKNVFNNLFTFECGHIVLGGDFNLVQNIPKDKKGGNQTTHFKSLEEIEMLKENMDLTEI